jgi:hypothetical protein
LAGFRSQLPPRSALLKDHPPTGGCRALPAHLPTRRRVVSRFADRKVRNLSVEPGTCLQILRSNPCIAVVSDRSMTTHSAGAAKPETGRESLGADLPRARVLAAPLQQVRGTMRRPPPQQTREPKLALSHPASRNCTTSSFLHCVWSAQFRAITPVSGGVRTDHLRAAVPGSIPRCLPTLLVQSTLRTNVLTQISSRSSRPVPSRGGRAKKTALCKTKILAYRKQ